jgi:methylthioribose-1-phosphate isomerase
MKTDDKAIAVEWQGDRLRLLDQTQLPHREVYLELTDYRDVAAAIKELKVRGAPAIGVAAAYGIALEALRIHTEIKTEFTTELQNVIQTIAGTRPTARNLFMAMERMESVIDENKSIPEIRQAILDTAIDIHNREIESTQELSRLGAALIRDGDTILTHCNAGPLATTGYGTALGVIIRAHEDGKNVRVYADETRPLCQGARLTTWELQRAGVPVTLITDSMAGYFMSRGEINGIIVGADRIAANGDTANKIGTYTLAVLAHEHGIPFYIAAPVTTIDPAIASGEAIIIEERGPDEVTRIQGVQIAPEGTTVANPAFDVTPHRYITAIITEKIIIREPYGEGIRNVTETNS